MWPMNCSKSCSNRLASGFHFPWYGAVLACWMMGIGSAPFTSYMDGAEAAKSAKGGTRVDPVKRAEALKRVCERLGVGAGKVIADVGCGPGTDTATFAEVVGATGKVYGEEIEQKPLDALIKKSQERKLSQVIAVLGASDDPRLPDGAVDMVYMHQVFHHFAKPAEMLRNLWVDLKPGGCLVIVDRQKGPPREWVDVAEREKKHFWIGETTVVRQAREAGFRFETVLDDLWPDKEPFVLVFRKPKGVKKPAGDPDLPLEIKGKSVLSALPALKPQSGALAFIGLDRGRSVLPLLREALKPQPRIYDVMLEEWTTRKDELPADVASGATNILRTINGDLPTLPQSSLQTALLVDSYSRLWEPEPLLKRLRQAVSPGGYLAILDRRGPVEEARRLAGHQRRIDPQRVKVELEKAGFKWVKELKAPAKDRFYLLFQNPE